MKKLLTIAFLSTALPPNLAFAAEPMEIEANDFYSPTDLSKKRLRSSDADSKQPRIKRVKVSKGSSQGVEKRPRELVDASNYISLDTCGDFCGFAPETIAGIISFSPIKIRELNKTFYYLSSGYTTPGAIGLETLPFKVGCFGNPTWKEWIDFERINLASLPSPAWFAFAKEVKNIPVPLVTKLKGSQVHTLRLVANRIGDNEANDLNLQGTQIYILDLSWNDIGAEGAKALNLQGTQVYTLDLYGNQIGAEGAKALNLQDTQVHSINLGGNAIGAEGAKALILQGTQVYTLALYGNQIGDEGAKGLNLQGTQVHTLDLSWNDIGPEGAKALNLQGTQVHTVDLSHNQIGAETQKFLRNKYPRITFIF